MSETTAPINFTLFYFFAVCGANPAVNTPRPSRGVCVCICVCVCFLPIHSGHQVRWTYQPGSHRRKVTQDFSSTFFLRWVPYFFSREGFSHSFPSSTVKSNLCANDLIVLHPLGIFNFVFQFFGEKNPVCRDRTHVLTCQRVTRYL